MTTTTTRQQNEVHDQLKTPPKHITTIKTMMRQTNMKTKAQPIPETSTGIAAIAKAFRNHHADYQRYPCQKGTRHCRCAPRLHRPPPWRPETPRECHTTKEVSIAGLRCPTGPPTIEAPNTAAPKEPCAPHQRNDTNARQGPKHSARRRHHHRCRLTSHRHQGAARSAC
jgi:hypothetical protein